jgi:hypothetical protein
MANLVHNEQMKSMAGFCMNLGVAGLTAAVLVPLFSPSEEARNWAVISLPLGVFWAIAMISCAMYSLNKLKE